MKIGIGIAVAIEVAVGSLRSPDSDIDDDTDSDPDCSEFDRRYFLNGTKGRDELSRARRPKSNYLKKDGESRAVRASRSSLDDDCRNPPNLASLTQELVVELGEYPADKVAELDPGKSQGERVLLTKFTEDHAETDSEIVRGGFCRRKGRRRNQGALTGMALRTWPKYRDELIATARGWATDSNHTRRMAG